MKKISKGIYEYKGYRVSNCGYYQPDHCVWWEAVNIKNGCADFHATTKKEIQKLIDEYDGIPYPKWGKKDNFIKL